MTKESKGGLFATLIIIPALWGAFSVASDDLTDYHPIGLALTTFVIVNAVLAWFFSSEKTAAKIILLFFAYCFVTILFTFFVLFISLLAGIHYGWIPLHKIGS